MTEIPSGLVMQLKFDPSLNPETEAIFADDLACTFYLAWRYGHIISQNFASAVWKVVTAIRRDNPKTVEELARLRFVYGLDVTPGDWANFAPEFLGFLTGKKTIGFAVKDGDHVVAGC